MRVAPVDLHELAEAVPAVPRLMRSMGAAGSVQPDAGFCEPFPQRLRANPNPVHLEKLLVSQLRPEVAVALPDQRHGLGPEITLSFHARPTTLP